MDIKITGEYVKLNPIEKNNLSLINIWYCQVDAFGYATGGKNPEKILLRMNNSDRSSAFISGINTAKEDNCIGLIAGEFKFTPCPLLWIDTFLVDTRWQRRHYGTHAFLLLSEYAFRHCHAERVYVSVFEENKIGRAFWTSLGFSCARILTEKNKSIYILEKVIQ